MDDSLIERAYVRYFPVILAKCARMLRDPSAAQDLAQETFLRLVEQRERIRDPQATLAWVYRTATRLAVDQLRCGAVPREELVLEGGGSDPERMALVREELERLVMDLEPRELEALILCRADGMSQEEVGRVLQISDRSVRRVLFKANRVLLRYAGGV